MGVDVAGDAVGATVGSEVSGAAVGSEGVGAVDGDGVGDVDGAVDGLYEPDAKHSWPQHALQLSM